MRQGHGVTWGLFRLQGTPAGPDRLNQRRVPFPWAPERCWQRAPRNTVAVPGARLLQVVPAPAALPSLGTRTAAPPGGAELDALGGLALVAGDSGACGSLGGHCWKYHPLSRLVLGK